MAEIYLALIALVLLAALVHALAAPARFYEYPYFMCAAFAVFILPQALSLLHSPGAASPAAVEAVLLMTLLCVAACVLGYRAPPSRWIVERSHRPVDDRRLFQCGVLFVVCGFVFMSLIGQMTESERGGSVWSGRATIYLFFASLTYPGFSICLRHALSRGGAAAWFWTAAGAVIPVVSIVLHGRREPAILFAVTVAITLYYEKRWVVPRVAAAAALVGAMLVIPATTEYRQALSGGLKGVAEVDLVGNFRRFLAGASILELRNAAVIIDATAEIDDYGWGTAYWDQLVFRFVPAQFVGKDFKDALMFRTSDERLLQEFAARGYRIPVGSTITGMADSFQQFGYGGALFFAALAVVFRSLWRASLQRGAVFAQLLYIQTTTSAMRAITHQTVDYLPGLAYNLIFLGLASLYARRHVWEGTGPPVRPAVR
jgi:hypothetical protein